MKTYHFILALFIMLPAYVFAQKTDEAKKLVDQGVALNDSGKYDQAIAKYKQAMMADSTYPNAYYETGYTLFSSGKEKEAIPYLEKLLSIEPKSAGGYDMLGSIYDDMHQSDKAIEYYKKGIEANPDYQRLHFNIAITYYKIGKFAESENAAIDAIKLDPKHASSQRIYAMATYREKKRGCSLMAWCSFLLLEPQSKRSREAMAYVKNIVNYGITRKDEKSINISVNPDEGAGNLMMPMAVSTALDGKKNLSSVDSVQFQLKSLFEIGSTIADEKTKSFATNYYASYFENLAKSAHMPAFTHYITLSIYKDEDLAWFKDHEQEYKDFQKWLDATKQSF